MNKIFTISLLFTLFGCGTVLEKKDVVTKEVSAPVVESVKENEIVSDSNVTIPNNDTLFNTPVIPFNSKVDSSEFDIEILQPDQYHGDEIEPGLEKRKWLALTKDDKGFHLRKVKLEIQTVEDPIIDSEKEKTGKKINVQNSDETIILISCIDLQEGPLVGKQYENDFLRPGENLVIPLLSEKYNLHATALV